MGTAIRRTSTAADTLKAATDARDEGGVREVRCLMTQVASACGRHAQAVALAADTVTKGLPGAITAGFFAAWARSAHSTGDDETAMRVVGEGQKAVERHLAQAGLGARAALWALPGYRELRAVASSLGATS